MNTQPQDTSAEEPDGGNPHIRFRGGPGRGNQPGLLNRWTPRGAHLLLQSRANVLNDDLAGAFRRWYPGFGGAEEAKLAA